MIFSSFLTELTRFTLLNDNKVVAVITTPIKIKSGMRFYFIPQIYNFFLIKKFFIYATFDILDAKDSGLIQDCPFPLNLSKNSTEFCAK